MLVAEKTIDIEAPLAECFYFWSTINNFPRFRRWIQNVEPTENPQVYQLEVLTPSGSALKLLIQQETLIKNQQLTWRTVMANDDDINMIESTTFELWKDNWARMKVVLQYNPPAQTTEEFTLNLFTNPAKTLSQDLENFKRLMMKQPSGVKSQAGLSKSGSTQGTDPWSPENPDPKAKYPHPKNPDLL
jgi:uncharacterized membrane protein